MSTPAQRKAAAEKAKAAASKRKFSDGRPRVYETPELLDAAVAVYFESTERPTLTGLCAHLGLLKQSFSQYGQREEFADVVAAARQRVEAKVEERLLYENAGAGAIFWLKNHAGYTDKQEQDVNLRGEFYVSDEPTIEQFDAEFAVGAAARAADSAD